MPAITAGIGVPRRRRVWPCSKRPLPQLTTPNAGPATRRQRPRRKLEIKTSGNCGASY